MEIMKKFITLLSVLFLGAVLNAQSADVISEILEAPVITYGHACYISASSQGLISDDASLEDAVAALVNAKQIPESVSAWDTVKLVNLAYIYSHMFNIKGGFMYRITKGSPRYVFKQMKTDGVIPANSDTTKILSGREALSLYTSCNMKYGEDQFTEEL